MGAPNDQAGVVHRSTSFAILLAKQGPQGLKRLARAFEKVVEGSYRSHPMRHRTEAEDKRRTGIVIEYFRTLQGDLDWTSDRCISVLRNALTSMLDGKSWMPVTKHKTLWAPDRSLVHVNDPALEPAGD